MVLEQEVMFTSNKSTFNKYLLVNITTLMGNLTDFLVFIMNCLLLMPITLQYRTLHSLKIMFKCTKMFLYPTFTKLYCNGYRTNFLRVELTTFVANALESFGITSYFQIEVCVCVGGGGRFILDKHFVLH